MKIFLIDFNCIVDVDGKPMGHTFNVAREIYSLLQTKNHDIVYVASPQYAKNFPAKETLPILRSVVRGSGVENNEGAIIKENFRRISQQIKDGILFFAHCDSYYARLLPKSTKSRKSIAIFYNAKAKNPSDGLLKKFLKKVYFSYSLHCIKKRIDVLIKTNKNLKFNNKNVLYMVDYYYKRDVYEKYRNIEKQPCKVVCLGQNNKHKQIIQIINKFKGSKYSLVIRGKFFDKAVYDEAISLSENYNNIVIEDNNISEEQYYSELASAKYCILPYDTGLYFERTTGVAIEAMFLDAVVIGPKAILSFNDISGISYDEIAQLDLKKLDNDQSKILKEYESKRNGEYAEDAAAETVEKAISVARALLQ